MGNELDDEVDSGWDDLPIAQAAPPISERDVPSAPAHEPLALVRLTQPRATAPDLESISPSEIEAPVSLPHSGRRSKVVGFAVVATAIAAAGIAWVRTTSSAGPTPVAVSRAAAPPQAAPPTPTTEPLPSPQQAEPTPTATAAPAPATAGPAIEVISAPLVLSAPEAPPTPDKQADTVEVTVKSVPEGAVFFEAGKRLGTSLVHLSVGHHVQHRLTALLDGYEPLNFKLDGTRASLTVRLSPAHAAPTPVADAPTVVAPTSAPASAPAAE